MNEWKWKWLSHDRSFEIPWTIQSTEFSRPEYWSGLPFLSPGDLPNPGIEPRSPPSQADSLPGKPQGKHKNTGMGSLSLLQWIFLTQESNPGLLHYRRILYQMSYQGTPNKWMGDFKTLKFNQFVFSLIIFLNFILEYSWLTMFC